MTLSTYVYVQGEINPLALFQSCQDLIGEHDEKGRCHESQLSKDEPSFLDETAHCLANQPGQGLPAWLMLHYRKTGFPLLPHAEKCGEDCESPCSYAHDPAHWAKINLDTTYGFKSDQGYGCGTLHAVLVASIGKLLDAQKVPWSWRNEFTGDLHQGYDGLAELADGGKAATRWFESVVRPAIEAMQ